MNIRNFFALTISFIMITIATGCFKDKRGAGSTQEPPIEPEPVAAIFEVSRSSGVAPLAVHFFAQIPPVSTGDKSFLDYEYTWNFGDATSGTWPDTGLSRNTSKGSAAAHVYETPGTYTVSVSVRNTSGIQYTNSTVINVDDPDAVFAGNKTVCVSDSAHADFTGAPAGANQITTDDLSTVTGLAQPGTRILFHRGSSWSAANLSWPENAGPVSIGAYGTGSIDSFGLYSNAPLITVTGGSFLPLDRKQDWRICDLALRDPTKQYGSLGGSMEMMRILQMRLRITGFSVALGWSHWNTAALMPLEQMTVWGCDLSGSATNVLYCGAERLAVLGTRAYDADASHVVRIWQAHKSIIAHNRFSGSSIASEDGRHALKLHGPGYSTLHGVNEYGTPADGTSLLAKRTTHCVVSDNVFGSSGPWPVTVAPQDSLTDALIENIVFERNRIASQFGTQSSRTVQVALRVLARNVVVRNNIIDGTASSNYYTAIEVSKGDDDTAPDPQHVRIYHNTIYRTNNPDYNENTGISISPYARNTSVFNNLAWFPADTSALNLLIDQGSATTSGGNILTSAACFSDPANADVLLRSFALTAGAEAINAAESVSVYDDFTGQTRNVGTLDIGAMEYR